MKSICVNLMLLFGLIHQVKYQVQAQSENQPLRYNKNGSHVWIILTNGAVLGKGLLWKVSDETLEFVKLEDREKYVNEILVLKIHYSEILEFSSSEN